MAATNHVALARRVVLERRTTTNGLAGLSTAAGLPEAVAIDALLEREDAVAVKRPTRAEQAVQEYTATNRRTAKPESAIPPMAEIRVDWKPPLQPWTEWAPAVDRFAVPLDSSPRSRGRFTFESSGLASPGRRSDGSAEKRKPNRQS
jgi:hypothetical protein